MSSYDKLINLFISVKSIMRFFLYNSLNRFNKQKEIWFNMKPFKTPISPKIGYPSTPLNKFMPLKKIF